MLISAIDPSWLRGFSLLKKCGQPGIFEARCQIPRKEIGSWLALPGQEIGLSLEGGGKEAIFYGLVAEASIERRKGRVEARLKAVSAASRQKERSFQRLFQKPEKTFGDVLGADILEMEKCGLELDSGLAKEALEPLVLQRENNFDFIARIGAVSGRKLWVMDTEENSPALALKHCLDDSALQFTAGEIINLRQIRLENGSRLELISEKYCALGRIARIEGIEGRYLASELSCSLEHGRDIFAYGLEEYAEPGITGKNPEAGRFALLSGKVAEAADPEHLGRVRFAASEPVADGGEKTWLPWQTPYAGEKGGFIFIGEKDAPASLLLVEGQGIVRPGPRRNALPEEAREVEKTKCLADNFGHRLLWKEDALEIYCGENLICLKEDEISIHVQDASLRVRKDDSEISINAKASRIAARRDNIQIFHDNSAIELKKDIDISAGGKVNITGSEINLG